jgi:hypothetical protein
MARLIFEKASITAAGNTTYTDNVNIAGIITESISMSEEALQVAIEDNQLINEGYTSTISFRTRDNVTEGGDALSTIAQFGASSTPTLKLLTMHGVNGANTYSIDNVYVMGRRVFENGREEFEFSAQIDTVGTTISKS